MATHAGRRRAVAAVLTAMTLGFVGGIAPVWSEPASAPTCTPELVHAVVPGDLDAAGAGVAGVRRLTIRSEGRTVVDESATVAWDLRATVDSTGRDVGAAAVLGGRLELAIRTESGTNLRFNATCVAGAGAWSTGVILYANGIRTGWPGLADGPTFVHFEAVRSNPPGTIEIYLALVDGRDCELDFASLVLTESNAKGAGTLAGLPARVRYSETDCSARFGDPKPAAKAPGLQ